MTNQPAPSDTPTRKTDAVAKMIGRLAYQLKCGDMDLTSFALLAQSELDKLGNMERELTRLSAEWEKERGELHLEIERLESRIADLDKEAGEIEDKRIDGVVTISGLRDTVSVLTNTLAERDRQLAEAEAELKEFRKEKFAADSGIHPEYQRGVSDERRRSHSDIKTIQAEKVKLTDQLAASERQRKEMEGELHSARLAIQSLRSTPETPTA